MAGSDIRVGNYVESEKLSFAQGLFEESSTKKERLGTIRRLDDGRVFKYCVNAGSALSAGQTIESAAPIANHLNQVVAVAAAVGDRQVSITPGNTAGAANLYEDGWFHINDADGEGHLYKVRSHPAIVASTAFTVTLYDSIRVALTTSSEWTLTHNEMKNVVVGTTAGTSKIVGISPIPVTASYYFWAQVKGPAAVLTDGTVVIGQHVMRSDGTAGAVEAYAPASDLEAVLGTVMRVNASTEYSIIDLNII